jgi:hypothetical protein
MFLLDQRLNVGGVLNLSALVVTASMTGEDVLAVDTSSGSASTVSGRRTWVSGMRT